MLDCPSVEDACNLFSHDLFLAILRLSCAVQELIIFPSQVKEKFKLQNKRVRLIMLGRLLEVRFQ